jgi:hypothetical protein
MVDDLAGAHWLHSGCAVQRFGYQRNMHVQFSPSMPS